jgi:hypothetical protein
MGKPSKASRGKDIIRLHKRKKLEQLSNVNQIKKKEEEIHHLQIEVQQLKKFISEAGEKVVNGFTRCNRENNNLLKWISIYTEQIKDLEKEVHLTNLRLYINTLSSQPSQQPSSQSSSQPLQSSSSQSSQSSQSFKSLDDYFKYERKQREQGKFYYFI